MDQAAGIDVDAPPIVVGVDGEGHTDHLVAWAAEESQRWHRRLVIAHAWEDVIDPDVAPADVVLRDEGQAVVDQWLAYASGLGATSDGRLVEGGPGPALVDLADKATMLIIGSRHRRTLDSIVHGSVAMYCVHHAACPVTVISLPRS